jgi:hypothetical protein
MLTPKFMKTFNVLRLKMMCLWQVISKNYENKYFFCILKINEKRSRIRIQICTKMSRIPNTDKISY